MFPSLNATSFCRVAVRHSSIPVFFPVARSCRISGKATVLRFPERLIPIPLVLFHNTSYAGSTISYHISGELDAFLTTDTPYKNIGPLLPRKIVRAGPPKIDEKVGKNLIRLIIGR